MMKRRATPLLVIVLVLAFMQATSATAYATNSYQIASTGYHRIGASAPTVPMDVDVAVLDTGIDSTHADLNVVGGYDCSGGNDYNDHIGHGTHVAGIIAAKDNGVGVLGVAPNARLWAIKVGSNEGMITEESMVCGLHWVLFHKDVIDVVNMSLGGPMNVPYESQTCTRLNDTNKIITDVPAQGVPPQDDDAGGYKPPPPPEDVVHDAVCQVYDAGITIVAAAGNSAQVLDGTIIPASYDEVITVSNMGDFDGKGGHKGTPPKGCPFEARNDDALYATTEKLGPSVGFFSGYTNTGEPVDIAAPGVCILSTWIKGGYKTISGTSMAAPFVTGAIARYLAQYPHTSPQDVKTWLLTWASIPQDSPNGFTNDPDKWHEPLLWLGPRPNEPHSQYAL